MKEGVESAEGEISGFHFTSSGKTPIKNFKAKGVDQRRFEKSLKDREQITFVFLSYPAQSNCLQHVISS